jgi:dTDP-4-amino-4,6-dideoxygalactose transaminase
MRNDFLPFFRPLIGQEEIDEVTDTLQSGWLTTGPKTKQFEADFAEYVGAPSALALSSCTAGLHLALVAMGVGRGDEVITTPMTFAATVNVIEHVGATPVLVDVEPDTLNIDPHQVADAMSPRTKVILPVHYAGHPAAMDELEDIAQRQGLTILEDAAHAIGGRYRGRPVGCGEHPTAFSFYATKNLITGEGGMLTGGAELMDHARVLGLHGMNRDAWKRFSQTGSWYYEVGEPGFKYNMTDIQASLGIWQLRKLAGFQQRRREVVRAYSNALESLGCFDLPVERCDVDHAWHLYVLRLRTGQLTISRDLFIERLKECGIGTSVHFIPIHLHPYYKHKYGFRRTDFPVALGSYERMLSLPLFPGITNDEVGRVIEAVTTVAASCRKRRAA